MEIEGNIIAVLPARSGVSQRTGNEWKSQEFVIETRDQYPRKMCFSVFGEDKLKDFNIKAGEGLKVSFDIDAHEYNGRWFNSISAWKVERTYAEKAAPVAQPTAQNFGPAPQTASSVTDDLPF